MKLIDRFIKNLKSEKRADYGLQLLKELSQQLKSEFGKGFDERNLRNMGLFI